jgi:hypothetical protein
MKNSILRGLFAASLLLVSSNAFAQNAAVPASLLASAEILTQIQLADVSPLKFGTLAAGKSKTVTTQSVATVDNGTIGGETAGVFSVTKAPGFSVTLTLSGLIDLPKVDANGAPIVGDGAFAIDTDYQADIVGVDDDLVAGVTSFVISGATSSVTVDNTLATLFGDGEIFVRIGGTLTPDANLTSGDYQTTITLNAIYN